jgi:DNA-3-methyladenine glycosylase II
MLFGELALEPFYETVEEHPVLGDVVRRLRGVKPTRPSSLFEMAVTAVTEQQISMAAAYQIRSRVIETFGDPVAVPDAADPGTGDDGASALHAFPTPETLAEVPLEKLEDCGLSRRKAEYIGGLAQGVVQGGVDFEGLRRLPNEAVRRTILALRGFGPWSADYILVRGLGRLDCVPVDDLGVRTVVGRYLGDGSRMTAEGVEVTLAPFKPYRGLVAFYLLAHSRLEAQPKDAVTT